MNFVSALVFLASTASVANAGKILISQVKKPGYDVINPLCLRSTLSVCISTESDKVMQSD